MYLYILFWNKTMKNYQNTDYGIENKQRLEVNKDMKKLKSSAARYRYLLSHSLHCRAARRRCFLLFGNDKYLLVAVLVNQSCANIIDTPSRDFAFAVLTFCWWYFANDCSGYFSTSKCYLNLIFIVIFKFIFVACILYTDQWDVENYKKLVNTSVCNSVVY